MDRLWQSLVVVVALALTAVASRPNVSDILKAERTRLAVTVPATPTASPTAPTVTQPDVQADEPAIQADVWPTVPKPTYPAYQLVHCDLGPDGFICLTVTPGPSATALPATAEPTATVEAYP